MFQNSNGTTAVTVDGDPVGYIADKSGNGNHWIQATASARPLYKTSGGKSWLLTDGVDDGLAVAGATFSNSMTAILGLQTSDTAFVTMWSPGDPSGHFMGVAQAGGSGGQPDASSGTPSYRVNNGAALARNRDALDVAVATGANLVLETRGADLSAYSGLGFGNYGGFEYAGRFYGLILAPESAVGASRSAALAYMAGKMTGVVLS
jgi:hypothetical protein